MSLSFDPDKYIEKTGLVLKYPYYSSTYNNPNECKTMCDNDPLCQTFHTQQGAGQGQTCYFSNERGEYIPISTNADQPYYYNNSAYEKKENITKVDLSKYIEKPNNSVNESYVYKISSFTDPNQCQTQCDNDLLCQSFHIQHDSMGKKCWLSKTKSYSPLQRGVYYYNNASYEKRANAYTVDSTKYNTKSGVHLDNSALNKLPYINENECQTRCDNDPTCQSFDIDIRYNNCEFSQIRGPYVANTNDNYYNNSSYEKKIDTLNVDSTKYTGKDGVKIFNSYKTSDYINPAECQTQCDNDPLCQSFHIEGGYNKKCYFDYNRYGYTNITNVQYPSSFIYNNKTYEKNNNTLVVDPSKYIEKKGLMLDKQTKVLEFTDPIQCVDECNNDSFCQSFDIKTEGLTKICRFDISKGPYTKSPGYGEGYDSTTGIGIYNNAVYEKIQNSAPLYSDYDGPFQHKSLSPLDSSQTKVFTSSSIDNCKNLCDTYNGSGFSFEQNGGKCEIYSRLNKNLLDEEIYKNKFSYIKKIDPSLNINTTGYNKKDNLFIDGNWSTINFTKAQECIDICNQNQDCATVQINKNNNKCEFSELLTVKEQSNSNDYINSSSYQKINPYPTQTNYQGPNINKTCEKYTINYPSIRTITDCKNLCDTKGGYCSCFSFNLNNKSCIISREKNLNPQDSPNSIGYLKDVVPPIEISFTDESKFIRKPGQKFQGGEQDNYTDPQQCLDRCLLKEDCKSVNVDVFGDPEKSCRYSNYTSRYENTTDPYIYTFQKKNIIRKIDGYTDPKENITVSGFYNSSQVANLNECSTKCSNDINCYSFTYDSEKTCKMTRLDTEYSSTQSEPVTYTKINNAYNITENEGYTIREGNTITGDLPSEKWNLSPHECLEKCMLNPVCNSVQAGKLGSQTENTCIYGSSTTSTDYSSGGGNIDDFVNKRAYIKTNPVMDFDGYNRLPNTKLHGQSNIFPYTTPKDCFDKCDITPDCKLVEVDLQQSSSGKVCSLSNLADDYDFSNDSSRSILFGSVYQKKVMFPDFPGYTKVDVNGIKQSSRLQFSNKSSTKTSLKDCIDFCTSDKECNVLEYSKENKTCKTNIIDGQYINGDGHSDELIYKKSIQSLPTYTTYKGPLLDKFLVQRYDLKSDIKTISECKAFCDKTTNCKSFSVNTRDGCFYSTNNTTIDSVNGDISYTKILPPTPSPAPKQSPTPSPTPAPAPSNLLNKLKSQNKTVIIVIITVSIIIIMMIFAIIAIFILKMLDNNEEEE
jgi:hypothetical protein